MNISTKSHEPLIAHTNKTTNSKAALKSFLLAFLLLCGHFTLSAATITVTNGNDAGAGSLRQAIASADVMGGDIIVFDMSVTTVTLTSGQLTIDKNLTINGGTGVTITRSAATDFRIFGILGGTTVVFNKLTITNGKAPDGGGIVNRGTLTLNDCILANNQAGQGGGLQNDGTLTMNRCFVHSNTQTAGGGGCGLLIYGSTTTLNNCVFTNNQVGWAIDIQSAGTLNITNCTIAKNTGGINVGSGAAVVTLKNTIVAENTTATNANILNNNVSASSAYNLIGTEGGNGGLTNGTNNNLVGISPLFANSSDPNGADNIFGTADDGLMLTTCSPALNKGNDADAPMGTDIVGNSRTFNIVDMGAYEVQANSSPLPSITLGKISPVCTGATSFTIPYTVTTGTPISYSISGTNITSVTDAILPSSPITVNLSAAASGTPITFTLTVKNAGGCNSVIVTRTPLTVNNGADAGAGSLRAAIADAVAGDEITFCGVTTVTLTSAQLNITKNLTINGGTGVTITRDAGATEFRIFRISSGVTVVFNKLTITNGINTSQAGGVNNLGNLTLNDCIVANNTAPQGGGLQNDGTMTMNRCVVHSNRATTSRGGGLIIYGSSTTLNNCVFANNQAFFDGSAISKEGSGSLMVTNCTIAKNSTSKGGGGLLLFGGSTTLKNTIVAENTAVTNPNIAGFAGTSSAYNLIGTEGGDGGLTNGTNNNIVGVSPMFANSSDPDGADNIFGTADDGLMLTACNFATNVGNNADAPSGTDVAGNTRIFNTTVDIGAYEFQANSSPYPTITLGAIPAILAGATSFTIPYTATSSPTTYSISGTGFSTVTDATLPSSPITVNLSPAASINIDFTLTVKNANGCTSTATTGSVIVNTPLTEACATANFNGAAPIAPTATTAGVGGRGGIHTYTVPAGVTAIRLDAKGAKGGSSPNHFNNTYVGGRGGSVQATYAVTPGDVLYILVGGKGGDGTLDDGITGRTASGGGGATVVSKGPIGSGTLLLVAGGGGGAGRLGGGGNSNNAPNSGSGFNGAGGASFSADGGNSNTSDDCGKGGQALNAGGYGGANTCFRPETNGGGYGGGGAGNYNTGNGNAGGGGGGGYVGGNAGATAGGNGGSSYTDASATNVTTTDHSDDNGSVVITVAATISYTGSPFCKSLTATAAPTITGYTGTGGTFSAIPTGLTIDATTGVINPSTSTEGSYLVSYNTFVGCPAATTTVRISALPTVSGPANLLDNNTTGQCGKIITYNTSTTGTPTPTISYTLTGATTGAGSGNGSGSFFNIGKTTVTLKATNSCGMGTYSFDVIVNDNEKPTITCPPSQTIALGSFECGRVVLFADPSVTDNCSSPTFERTDAFKTSLKSGSSFSAGTYPLSYRATDAAGNFVDCNFTIQVNGQLTTGRLKCIPTLTVSLDERQCTNTLDAVGLLIDNTYYCSNFYNTSIPGRTNNYLTSADIGKTFTVTVGDNFNNSCSTIVTVVDTKAPVLNALQDAVVTCADVSRDGRILATLSQPTIIYECGKTTFRTQDRAINLPAGQTSFNTRPDGFPADKNFDFTSAFNASRIIVRTYTATDESNNTSSVQQVIYVKSIDLSQVECPRDVTLSCTQSGFSTDIQSAGIPFVRGGRSLQEVSCGIDYLYSDERTNNAQGYVIKRTFTLTNLSNNLRQTCTQTITVNCVNIPLLAISGSINKETGESVSAMVKVANSTEMMAEMQGETFSFNNLVQGNSYRIQPERDNDVTNGVSTFDIALLSKHILGIQPFTSPYQIIAADVNRDGGIDATDMVLIRNLILRRITRFPSNTAWRFIPKSFVFADNKNPFSDDFPEVLNYNNLSSNMDKADFVAVKVGDVNLNARAANVLSLATRTARPTENIYLMDKKIEAGKEYIFDLNIKNSTLNALQLALKIDKTRVNSFTVQNGNLPEWGSGNVEINEKEGIIAAAWANTSKSTVLEENSIIQLKITPRQSAWLHELVSLDEQNMDNLAYDTDPSRVLGGGIEKQIKLKFNAFKTENLEFALHQNRPNPFIAETTISFVLPETSNAILSIYDVNGREVYTMKQGFNKGYNEVKLDNTVLKNAGIYFYRLQSDKFTATKRMQFFMN